MKMKFGMYKGVEMSAIPIDYLKFIVNNFDDGDIKSEASRILKSPDTQIEHDSKSLEEQANIILGEKPIGLLKRGHGRFKRR